MYIFFDREADVKYKLLLHMEQEITERYEHLEEQLVWYFSKNFVEVFNIIRQRF